MAIDFRREGIRFDPTSGRTQVETRSVVFNSRVIRAEVALNGFDIKFTDGDRPISQQIIDTSISGRNDNTVTVEVRCLLRDSSGSIDDRFEAKVDFLVIAEVA